MPSLPLIDERCGRRAGENGLTAAAETNPPLLTGDPEFSHPIDERRAINSEPHMGVAQLFPSDSPGGGRLVWSGS